MRVLFLLSCLEAAGSETYCLSLADTWKSRHDVFWISDQVHYGQKNNPMPIHMKAFPMGVVNTWRVANFIKENKIEIVHSHSRRANWVAAQAASIARIPHVATVHQPMPVHFFSTAFPCLGDETIAIDEAIVDHLKRDFGVQPGKIHLIRNGVDLSRHIPTQRPSTAVKQLLLIGRLSGGRWKVFQTFLEVLERYASLLPPAHYKVVGQIPLHRREEVAHRISVVNSKISPSTIQSMGHVQDLELLVRNSDGAIGAGRSALECLAISRPVILMGEGGILGLCKPEIWPHALRTNLGDHLEIKDFNLTKLERGLREMLGLRTDQQEVGRLSRAFVEQYYDLKQVASQVEAVYRKALS